MKKILGFLLFLMMFIFMAPVIKTDAAETWFWPVPSKAISSASLSRGYSSGHDGLDIVAPLNTPVVAARAGTVCRVVHGDIPNVYIGGGNAVVINHGGGIYSHYAHLNSTAVNVNQQVQAGQVIGYMGSTGNSTGVHLHFAIATNSYGGGGRINNNIGAINYVTNREPLGCFDEAKGKENSIFVRGWAFDPDNPSSSVYVHVYVGGPAGSGAPCYAILANTVRDDVNKAYGISGNHGFNATINVSPRGSQNLYVYAIDTAGGNNPHFGTKNVYITNSPKVSSVKITGSTHSVLGGKTLQLRATVSPGNITNKKVTWTSSNTSVATVNQNGLVTMKLVPGGKTVTIKATAKDGSGKSGSWKITSKTVKVASLKISGISNRIAAGRKVQLRAIASPNHADNKKVKWTTTNSKIAVVDHKGLMTVKGNNGGKTVNITATALDGSGKKASWKITVMKGYVRSVTIQGAKATLQAGKTLQLKAVVKATAGANKTVRWTSSNTKFATVSSSGQVKALKEGKGKTVKITVMATDGTNKSKSVNIKIY